MYVQRVVQVESWVLHEQREVDVAGHRSWEETSVVDLERVHHGCEVPIVRFSC